MLVSAQCWEVPQLHTGVYSALAPSARPGVSPPTPKELSFGAEQLCVHVPDKGLQTSVCDGRKAETLLP